MLTIGALVLGFGLLGLGTAVLGGEEPLEGELKVMTFNIRYGTANDGENAWPHRKEMVFETINRHRPDVLGLQEALDFQIEEILAACPGYRWYGVGRDDGVRAGEYSPVLYRADRLGVLEAGTRWISETPEVVGSKGPGTTLPRIFTWVKFQDKQGGRFLVLNAHFDHQSAAARLMGAEQMAAFAKGQTGWAPVLMGDFNCGAESEPVRYLRGAGFREAKPAEGPWGTFTGFRYGAVDGEMIDHLFYGAGWEMVSAETDRTSVGGRYPSDHFPVVARLRRN